FFMRQFGNDVYRADRQNWDIVQDAHGLMYFGNNHGVLEYDGIEWALIPIANNSVVRSLGIGPDGVIYVGGYAEVGYLEPDSKGRMTYRSLLDRIPEEDRGFTDVWTTRVLPDGVYFQTTERLFRWSDGAFTVWDVEGMDWAFAIGDRLFLQQDQHAGLFEPVGDSVRFVPGSDVIPYRASLVPGADDTFWALAEKEGIFRCQTDPIRCERVRRTSSPYIEEHWVYAVDTLANGGWALGLYDNGILITDSDGAVLRHIGEEDGLYSGYTTAIFRDRDDNLWVAHEKGLSYIIVDPNWTYFDGSNGLSDPPGDMLMVGNDLYVANVSGVHRLEPGAMGQPARFVPLAGEARECAALLPSDEGLLAGCVNLYRVTGDRLRPAWKSSQVNNHIYSLLRPKRDTSRIIVGLSGLSILSEQRGGALAEITLEDYHEFTARLVETPHGYWMTNEIDLIEMRWPDGFDAEPRLAYYGVEQGLPGVPAFPLLLDGALYATSNRGLYRAVYAAERPDSVTRFEQVVVADAIGPIQKVKVQPNGTVWALSEGVLGTLERAVDGSWMWRERHRAWAERMPEMTVALDDALWLTVGQRQVRYVPGKHRETPAPLAIIRSMQNVTRDTLVTGMGARVVTLPYSRDEYRIHYAGASFMHPEAMRFRTRLDGHDEGWSAWTVDTHRDLANLSVGRHILNVQLRDFAGAVSDVASLEIRVMPPWYLTTWAFVLWLFVAVGLLAGTAVVYNQVRSYRLEQRNSMLQRSIAERTEEIIRQKQFVERQNMQLARNNEALEHQQLSLATAYSQLQSANEELNRMNRSLEERTIELRDALEENKLILGVTAHDLKNPLGGIIGLADMLLEDGRGEPSAAKKSLNELVPMVKDEAVRMFGIITDLLDKHRQGEQIRLSREMVCISDLVTPVLGWNRQQAEQKSIRMHFLPRPALYAEVDPTALQRVIDNLLSNAIKYSHHGANVWIEVAYAATDAENTEASLQAVRVAIRDEGPGLTAEDKQRVFGKLQRLSAQPTAGEHSSGLGLYIVKQLVEAHGGTVGVDSEAGQGATFWFTIPVMVDASPLAESVR
ncbi:MAG: HAMP domain-containing sensor histidine kinase, partial [Rhodothermales bacterium]